MKAVAVTLFAILLASCGVQPENPALAYQVPSELQGYSRLLTTELVNTGRNISTGDRIAVTSPVWLDSSFQSSPLVARQLQEEISAELHLKGLTVIEYKLTDAIRVTPQGDFALSKNYLELRELHHADYILAGTLVERDNGIILNARLIDFNTQVIRATAQVTLPAHLINDIRTQHGIELVTTH